MGDEVHAVTVVFSEDDDREKAVQEAWKRWDPGVELVVLRSQYHSVSRPLVRYVGGLKPSATRRVVLLIPVVQPRRFWHRALHNHLDLVLSSAFRRRRNVVVAKLPLPLREE
jgi:hypothetical protein